MVKHVLLLPGPIIRFAFTLRTPRLSGTSFLLSGLISNLPKQVNYWSL